MSAGRWALAILALLAFAANSLLARAALAHTAIDAGSFTLIRVASGAAVLAAIVAWRGRRPWRAGRPSMALALTVYALAFAWAYEGLGAATGALLLFAAVQATMLGASWRDGERPGVTASTGLAAALAGVVVLLLPGATAPASMPALLMLGAGVAWGLYSLGGRGSNDPVADTAGQFLKAVPMTAAAVVLGWGLHRAPVLDPMGMGAALASGAVASGLGYVAWYAALPALGALRASALQLAVPAITAGAAVLLLGEPLSARLLGGGALVRGGLAAVLRGRVARPARTG